MCSPAGVSNRVERHNKLPFFQSDLNEISHNTISCQLRQKKKNTSTFVSIEWEKFLSLPLCVQGNDEILVQGKSLRFRHQTDGAFSLRPPLREDRASLWARLSKDVNRYPGSALCADAEEMANVVSEPRCVCRRRDGGCTRRDTRQYF